MFFKEREFSKDPVHNWEPWRPARPCSLGQVIGRRSRQAKAYGLCIHHCWTSNWSLICNQSTSPEKELTVLTVPFFQTGESCEFSERHFALLTDLSWFVLPHLVVAVVPEAALTARWFHCLSSSMPSLFPENCESFVSRCGAGRVRSCRTELQCFWTDFVAARSLSLGL